MVRGSGGLSGYLRTALSPLRSFKYLYRHLRSRHDIRRALAGGPVVCGPWTSEIGFELLYWIPFLRWFKEMYDLPEDRLITISRGGNQLWYQGISGRHINLFEHLPPGSLFDLMTKRVQERNTQKQMWVDDEDRDILKGLVVPEGTLLHPSVMYRLFSSYWAHADGLRPIRKYTSYDLMPRAEGPPPEGVPARYVYAKFYSGAPFPYDEANRTFVADLLGRLGSKIPVVTVDVDEVLDDHEHFDPQVPGIIRLRTDAKNNLELQTRLVMGASAFVGTYGGFSYLAPFYGVPSISFTSTDAFMATHLSVALHVFTQPGYGPFLHLGTRQAGALGVLASLA